MYKCDNCGKVFDEPLIGEMEKDTGYTPHGCPYCGDDYYTEGHACPICGEWTDDILCEGCTEEYHKKLSELKSKIMEYGVDDYNAGYVLASYFEK